MYVIARKKDSNTNLWNSKQQRLELAVYDCGKWCISLEQFPQLQEYFNCNENFVSCIKQTWKMDYEICIRKYKILGKVRYTQ